jgi:hypothetical protein
MHTSNPPADAPRTRLLRVRLTDEEHSRLRSVAVRQGRPMAEVVRSAIRFTSFAKKDAGSTDA